MSIDPTLPMPMSQEGRSADRLAELERRLDRLERGNPTIIAGTAAPTSAPRDGTPYLETTTPRLYLRSGGVWRYTTLT